MSRNPISPEQAACLRQLPAVDELLRRASAQQTELPRPMVAAVVRELIDSVRTTVLQGKPAPADAQWDDLLKQALGQAERHQFVRVINATGVVLHTNLGRAPLSAEAMAAIAAVAGGYNNLEYEVGTGERGSRHLHGETMLRLLTGAEAAMVVNNGAAAILLVLSALTAGKDVLLSRGEMIEIGGSFRVPEVMAQSGCQLVEVGATNRTHLRDYEQALKAETGAILKVHTSNYRISGFTSAVSGRDLATLAHAHNIPLIEDLGSGVLLDTAPFGLTHEPTIQEVLANGVDIVTCSGDKLLGGPQAGLILGRADLVSRCKRHPLARALRVGKLTLAALQATLGHYLRSEAMEKIPIWRMTKLSVEEIGKRAEAMAEGLREVVGAISGPADSTNTAIRIWVQPGLSAIGGGSLPGETLPTVLLALSGEGRRAPQAVAARLRASNPPVVARVEAGELLIDLRTIDPADDATVLAALCQALA